MNRSLINMVVVSWALLGVGLGGCSKKEEVKESAAADCVFPGTEAVAPGWVCHEEVPGLEIQALGIAEKSAAGISFMTDMAAADARGRIAEQMKLQVSKMVKKYLGTTGLAASETVDQASESVTKTITSESLTGSKVIKSRQSPDGRLFVVVGLDPKAFAASTEKAVRTSMGNDQALWQQFKAQKAHDEMAADIAKQRVE